MLNKIKLLLVIIRRYIWLIVFNFKIKLVDPFNILVNKKFINSTIKLKKQRYLEKHIADADYIFDKNILRTRNNKDTTEKI